MGIEAWRLIVQFGAFKHLETLVSLIMRELLWVTATSALVSLLFFAPAFHHWLQFTSVSNKKTHKSTATVKSSGRAKNADMRAKKHFRDFQRLSRRFRSISLRAEQKPLAMHSQRL
jgi:hypothetical protein